MSRTCTERKQAEREQGRRGNQAESEFQRGQRLIGDHDVVARKQRRPGRGDWIGSPGENACRPLTSERNGCIEEEAAETVGVESILEVERHLPSEFIAKCGRMQAQEQAIENSDGDRGYASRPSFGGADGTPHMAEYAAESLDLRGQHAVA